MKDNTEDTVYRIVGKDKGRGWWKLPFDATTNFSLFGFLLGGFRCDAPGNRTDLTLEDE